MHCRHSSQYPDVMPNPRLSAQDKNKPVLFTMARLDRVKNLTGLVEWFGRNQRLRGLVNLVVVGGIVDPGQTSDRRAPQACMSQLCM